MSEIVVPDNAIGLRLCKVVKGKLHMSEDVMFTEGRSSVNTVLRRAAVSGKVGPIGETGDFWADFLEDGYGWSETIALDRRAWNSLKNKWMPCRMEKDP